MADVFVYAPNCENFDNIGEAGSLTPISCVPTEIGNGMWDLELVHPIDEMGKWSYLQNGYIIAAEAPVRTLPEIGEDGLFVTSVENWTVKLGASGGARQVYNKASGGKVISTNSNKPKPGAKVTVVAKGTNRYKIKFRRGSGWIAIAALENKVDVTIPNTAAGIEQEAAAWSIRPQRFRIYKVEKTDNEVTVLAKHVFYDQTSNITTYKADNPTCVQALSGLIAGRVDTTSEIVGRTNIVGTRVGVDWTRARFCEALLDPDAGLVKRWNAKLIRDDEEFCVLADAGVDRGVTIEYGKNLVGVQLGLDYSNIVTRYIPIGQQKNGKPLELAPGTYTTDHGTIVIPAGAKWVDASNIGDYQIPLVEVLDLGSEAKASGTEAAQIKDAREKMIDACLYKWEREQTNYPSVTLNVDFAQLGDTAEYAQYRQLENIFLFDKARIRHPGIDVDILAEVTEMAWDSLNDRADHITMGKVNPASIKTKLPTWQLPAAIPGTYIAPGTFGLGAVNDTFENDLNMTDNQSVQNVAQQYVRNAWITGEQVFKYAAGSSTPSPLSIIVSANLQNVLMGRWQYKNSSGSWVDYPTGDGNTTNTSTALVVKPGHAVWVDGVCTLKLLTDDVNINDTFCLYKVSDGATGDTGATGATGAAGLHGLTAILSNAAHTLPKTTDGAITYTGSGTTLRLFEGATELAYDGAGVNNGTWKVGTTASGITRGSLTDSGLYLTVGNHSAMTGNTASVTFSITGKRANGTAIALSVTQTLSIAQQGATGTPAVVLTVYAPNGSVFTNQVGTLLLSAVGYSGANQITTGATYQWKKYTGGSWVTISGATASTLSVSGADVAGLQAYKCEMTYGGVVYSGTITLTDKTDNYQASISSTGGDTFRNGVGSSAMVCRLWQNGAEADALKSAVISETAPSSPVTGQFYYKITPSTPQVALMRWSGSAWVDVTTNPTYAHTKSYTWYRLDKDWNALDGGAAFATGKVIYVDGDDVDVQTTWECEVA